MTGDEEEESWMGTAAAEAVEMRLMGCRRTLARSAMTLVDDFFMMADEVSISLASSNCDLWKIE